MNKLVKLGTTLLATLLLVGCNASGNESGNESLPINQEESAKKMENLAASDGYYLRFKYSSEENGVKEDDNFFYYGEKGNTLWCGTTEDEGIAVVKEENSYHAYSLEEGAYVFEQTYTEEEIGDFEFVYAFVYTSWLYYGNAYDGSLKKGNDTKVAGRDCYTYTFSMSEFGSVSAFIKGASLKYEIAVDKELGITMKLSLTGKADGESGSFNYEVLEFVTGSKVTVPTLPAPVKADAGEEE